MRTNTRFFRTTFATFVRSCASFSVVLRMTIIMVGIFFLSIATTAQDSIRLKIQKIGSADGKRVFWLKDMATKDRYITICDCAKLPAQYKKGDTITIPRSRLQVIKESFNKRDLEN